MSFDFDLDEDGSFSIVKSKYGAGITVEATAEIDHPAARYDVTITSSTGGGGEWTGVQAGEAVSFQIQTSFWKSTEITVSLRTDDARNASGTGRISYRY